MPPFVPGSARARSPRAAALLRGVLAVLLGAALLAALTACSSSSSDSATLQSVAVTPSEASLEPGETQQLAAIGTYSNGTTQNITAQLGWSVNNTAVATVDQFGLVTAVGEGTVTVMAIDATTAVSDTAMVTVMPAVTAQSITVSPENVALGVGSTLQLTAARNFSDGSSEDATADVSWFTDDADVATVSNTGLTTALAVGSASISATDGTFSGQATVAVCTGQNVFEIDPATVLTSLSGTVDVQVPIPSPAVSIGIIALGTDGDYKFVEHNGLLLGGGGNITGPGTVPLAFNMIDFGDGEEPTGDNLANLEAEALFFPNDGTTASLPAGTYTFPVGSFDPNFPYPLTQDTITPYVFYKTCAPAAGAQTMNVNLFVVEGVVPGATNAAEAEADPEVAGAITVLRNVYETRAGLTLNVNVEFIADSSFAVIDSEAEQNALVSSYPLDAPGTALNLFIIGAIGYLDPGVIGYSLGIPGPFNLDGTIVSGTLAEYQGDGQGNILGFTLAHEFGHFLGLWHPSQTNSSQTGIIGHDPIADTPECTTADVQQGGIDNCPDRTNLMFPIVDNAVNPPITNMQATVIQLNPAVSVPLQ